MERSPRDDVGHEGQPPDGEKPLIGDDRPTEVRIPELEEIDGVEDEFPRGETDYSLEQINSYQEAYLGSETQEPAGIPFEHVAELKLFLTTFKVHGIEEVREEELEKLWLQFDRDPFLVEDFVLVVADRMRRVYQSYGEIPSFNEIKQYAAATRKPTETRNYLINEIAAPAVFKLNVGTPDSRLKFFDIASSKTRPRNARAARFVGWLAAQPPMDEFKYAVDQAVQDNKMGNVRNLTALATLEIINRQRHHELLRTSYEMHIPVEKIAYDKKQELLEAYRNICDIVFLGLPPKL